MREYTVKRREQAERQVKWLLSLEKHAYTLNEPLLQYYKKEFLQLYHERPQTDGDWDISQTALVMMATVRAYFQGRNSITVCLTLR